MANNSSRRNRRTASIRNGIAMLAVSACIFLGGLASLAWAVSAAQVQDADQPASSSTQKTPDASGDELPQTGVLVYPGIKSAESPDQAQADEEAPNSTDEKAAKPKRESPEEGSTAASSSREPKTEQREAPGSSFPDSARKKTQQTQRTKTIHHTAFERVAVYKTVTHKAAVKHVTDVGGETVTTWTLCPVCGQRHSKSYKQKVLSGYKNVYCKVCGKKHDKSYTETVRY